MALVTVDLDPPYLLRGRWAAVSAIRTALDYGRSWDCCANGPDWHYHDGGGNWMQLTLLDGDRAVLFGNDHEYSDTYFREAAEEFGEPETDLLAGTPDWFEEAFERPIAYERWYGFIYGFDDGGWRRAEYVQSDGFTSVGLPAASAETAATTISYDVSKGDEKAAPSPEAVHTLLSAGADLTEAQLAAVALSDSVDLAAGVAAARRFRPDAVPDPVPPWVRR